MTAVAAVRIADTPTLVGDVVLTDRERKRIDHAGKIYELARNVALGWSGHAFLAREALTRLRWMRGQLIPLEVLDRALDDLDDLRARADGGLVLTGWIVTSEGPKVIRWATHYPTTRFSDAENDIGDGGSALRKMLAEPEIGFGNTTGHDVAPMKLITGFSEARFEEALLRDAWPTTWGAAYDALVYQEGFFRWMPKLTYVGWDVFVDNDGRITDVQQAPVVFTQEHIHPCTRWFSTMVGAVSEVQVSYPIDADELELDALKRLPPSVVSPYYANYFRIFCPDKFHVKMSFTAVNATPAGVMCHVGADEKDPRFQVNRPVFEPHVRDVLQAARASAAYDAQPTVSASSSAARAARR